MKIAAIITEYNPFHYGHLYQIKEIRKQLGKKTAIIVVMSGSFTQRGEPAILDKWERAHIALKHGVDLVVELPNVFACSTAEIFARGAVHSLHMTQLKMDLVFGTELGSLAPLEMVADILMNEPESFKTTLAEGLKKGLHYAQARNEALAPLLPSDIDWLTILKQSNNILGVEYLKALRYWNAQKRITPLTIQRQGQDFKDVDFVTEQFLSATAIRSLLKTKTPDLNFYRSLAESVPDFSFASIHMQKNSLAFADLMLPYILASLQNHSLESLIEIPGFEGGLAQRVLYAFKKNRSEWKDWDSLFDILSSRTFSKTRISRAFCALLLGIEAKDLSMSKDLGVSYLRTLGFTKQGQYILKELKKRAKVPIIMNNSDFEKHKDKDLLSMQSRYDNRADDLRNLITCGTLNANKFTPPLLV